MNLSKEQFEKLKFDIQSDKGVEVKDRRYMLRTYKSCFVGYEAVDWIFSYVSGMKTRDDAINICQKLLETGLIEDVYLLESNGNSSENLQKQQQLQQQLQQQRQQQPLVFKDDYLFYSFVNKSQLSPRLVVLDSESIAAATAALANQSLPPLSSETTTPNTPNSPLAMASFIPPPPAELVSAVASSTTAAAAPSSLSSTTATTNIGSNNANTNNSINNNTNNNSSNISIDLPPTSTRARSRTAHNIADSNSHTPLIYVNNTNDKSSKRDFSLLKDEVNEKGIKLQKKKKNFLGSPINCFSGSQLIDWLMTRLDIGRREATKVGQRLLNLNIFFEIGLNPVHQVTSISTTSLPVNQQSSLLSTSTSSSSSTTQASSSPSQQATTTTTAIQVNLSSSLPIEKSNLSNSASSDTICTNTNNNNSNSNSNNNNNNYRVFYEFLTKPEAIISHVAMKKQNELHLAHKSMTSIPLTIINTLNYLKILDLSYNSMVEHISLESVATLYNLESLNLSHNSLSNLPSSFNKLERLTLQSLSFPDTVKVPPKSVTSKGFSSIMGYLRDVIDGSVALPHLKLIVLGNEKTGKTSLVRSLTKSHTKTLSKNSSVGSGASNRRQSGTILPGATDIVTPHQDPIEYTEWKLDLPHNYNISNNNNNNNNQQQNNNTHPSVHNTSLSSDNLLSSPKSSRKLTLSLSSSGGSSNNSSSGNSNSNSSNNQDKKKSIKLLAMDFKFNSPDIYHNTHQFFLSERAFYLITFDINKDPLASGIDFWVNSIKAKAPTAPIYIVATHLDAIHHSSGGDVIMKALHNVEAFLNARYLEVTGVIGVSCHTQRNIDLLKQEILTTLIQQQTWINEKIPLTYASLETSLLEEAKKRMPPIVSWSEYCNIAKLVNITSQEKLVRATQTLHRWGSIMWFDDEKSSLKDIVILSPQWLSDCFAALVLAKHSYISSDSILNLKKLRLIWKAPIVPEEIHITLIKILERLQVLYSLKDQNQAESSSPPSSLTSETRTVSAPIVSVTNPIESASPSIISSSATSSFLLSTIPENNNSNNNNSNTGIGHASPTQLRNSLKLLKPTLTPFKNSTKEKENLNNFIRVTKIILPCLLPYQKPSHLASLFDTWSGVDELQIGRYYQFTNAPKSCFERLMVRFLYLMEPIVYWRTGILFRKPHNLKDSVKTNMSSCGTLVEFDTRSQQLQLRVRGHDFDSVAKLFQIVLENIDTLIKDQGFSSSQVFIPCACTVTCRDNPHLYPIESVESSFDKGEAYIHCPATNKLMCIEKIAPDITLSSVPSSTKISFEEITSMEQIGVGASAKVFKGYYHDQLVAVKQLNLERLDLGSELPAMISCSSSGSNISSGSSTPQNYNSSNSNNNNNNNSAFQRQLSSSSLSSTSSSEESSLYIQPSKLSAINEFRREVWLMSDLSHPNIVVMKGFCFDPYSIVMEYMDLGSLSHHLRKKKECNETLPWDIILKIAKDVASGMSFLHNISPPLVHRDLKSPNILLSTQMESPYIVAKVSDFGLSRAVVQGFVSKVVDNPTWLAPEVLKGFEYNEKGDIYSFGMILWELYHLELPFEEYNIKFMSTLEDNILNGLRPTINPLCNKMYASLITKCWNSDPQYRPSFQTIVKTLDDIISSL
ncbi:leucine-rich repeat-containing protein [Heterostelium album PN500]|uniref:non-specific serine/threonine protein kinase n=1 Tax=Heterostelium pallidum (strain ATCC 26659 / Pp 5 / PN500) TaxID=670386 RepID=D3B8P4_HETP5|nr:leucine-rich repeat-containing protein [Heterostelium album PN500]EFA82412.1 leucine-rich repeat-containing protein [Heterostelium album PN500]|eukprot:XP_020434529.1 leucine-rich repeat-containing protein [Heterostelium album PN500]